jgi:hypothetical protein
MSKMSREDLLKLLAKCNPRTRRTVMRVIEGKVSQDHAAFIQEQLNFVEPDLTVRSVDFISSRTCDFGHMLDQQTRLVAVCERCGRHTCSAQGSGSGSSSVCSFTCARCGKALCRCCAHVHGTDEAYCLACWPVALLRWAILGKRR